MLIYKFLSCKVMGRIDIRVQNTFSLFLLSVFLIACGNFTGSGITPEEAPQTASLTVTISKTLTPLPSQTPTWTHTVTPTHTPTPTQTLTSTITPTKTPSATPTETLTPTSTLTPMPVYNAPGTYQIGKCVELKVPVTFCVLSVNVLADRSMVFNVSWETRIKTTKKSDKNNPNMFIRDNLGNRYHHIHVGGDAAIRVVMNPGDIVYGSFTFPPALPGATSFEFRDSDQGRGIPDIVLSYKP